MITATTNNLNTVLQILNNVNNDQYCDGTIPPFGSSLGKHIRHVLAMYDKCLEAVESGVADLTQRDRGSNCEEDLAFAKAKTKNLIDTFKNTSIIDTDVTLTDDVGDGIVTYKQSLEGLFAYTNSHTIHHFAVINFLIHGLEIEMDIPGFGYNPTTPIAKKSA